MNRWKYLEVMGVTVTLAAFACLYGCGGGDSVQVAEKRTVEAPATPGESSTADRMGIRPMGDTMASAQPGYHWETPDGWKEVAPTDLRIANFLVGPNGEAECYLTELSGTGGGLEANVNRWRQQMSLTDYSDEEFAALPTIEVLGEQATFVEIEGTFTGMQGAENNEGYKLLGAILEHGGKAIFVKMTGPAELVTAEKSNFEAFCKSIHSAESHGGAGDMAHGGDAMSAPVSPHSFSASGLAWDAPEGWTKAPDRQMREVTFILDAPTVTECYVTKLTGNGGGIPMNINRWRDQMGQDPLSDEELAQLPRIEMLGEEGVFVEVTGDFQGMAGPTLKDYGMLGAICELPQEAYFVKFTGPADIIAREKDKFIAFCKSLRIEPLPAAA